jgi:hypothetical protein
MTKPIVAFRNFANSPKMQKQKLNGTIKRYFGKHVNRHKITNSQEYFENHNTLRKRAVAKEEKRTETTRQHECAF